MISANDARKKSEQNQKRRIAKEIKLIEKRIFDASDNGKYEVTIASGISGGAIQMLSQLGYKIKQGEDYNETYTSIMW